MSIKKSYYFCGVGGSGMSPLARLLAARGAAVTGSDRSFDSGRNEPFFRRLSSEGITLVPQDGSGVTKSIDAFVVTRAVEESIPDIRRARELGIPIVKRPQLMAELFSGGRAIAVGGTSGKSTTTGMIGFALRELGLNPTIVNGAEMIDFGSNFAAGSEMGVFEADESDGLNDVVGLCRPAVAVLTNVSLDHFELAELEAIFGTFISQASEGVVLNADCPISMKLAGRAKRVVTFGVKNSADVMPNQLPRGLSVRGSHNVANALAAIAAVRLLGLDEGRAADAAARFQGMRRRVELIADVGGVKVFDDFASNPGKIEATLRTLAAESRRLIAIFQPHGFQPTKLMLEGYIETFARCLRPNDRLLVPPIYYAGGTANIVEGKSVALPTDISGNDIVVGVCAAGRAAQYLSDRAAICSIVPTIAAPGDAIVVMGSRDETLPDLAREIAAVLR